jgi:histidine ammonia-lyase
VAEPTHRPIVSLGDHALTLDEYASVISGRFEVRLSPEAVERMERYRASLLRQLAGGTRIYGVNTGYGADSITSLEPGEIRAVQRNTVVSHAMGTGEIAPPGITRGMLLLKASVLAQGYSACRPVVAELVLELLNRGILPVIPEQGSLAASGDLVSCGHLGSALLGEGDVRVGDRQVAAAVALAEAGLTPLQLEEKEGLALVNGTTFTEAYALEAVLRAERLLRAADVAAAASLQALKGFLAAFEERSLTPRPFPGALLVAGNVRRLCLGSPLLEQPPTRVHDPYCLRCVPQVHGASRDAFRYVKDAVLIELTSVTDNPLVFADDDTYASAGNFHAQPIGIPMDTLTVLVAEMASISQRRVQHLVAPVYAVGLPPKLSPQPKMGSGLFMLNTTAAALVSENKTLSFPASVDSVAIDTTEDHVSMGSVAARKAMDVVANTARVLAIELICACQAFDLHAPLAPSPAGSAIHDMVRQTVPFLNQDRGLSSEVEALAARLLAGDLDAHLEACGIDLR